MDQNTKKEVQVLQSENFKWTATIHKGKQETWGECALNLDRKNSLSDLEKIRLTINYKAKGKLYCTLDKLIHDSDEGYLLQEIASLEQLKNIIADIENILLPKFKELKEDS